MSSWGNNDNAANAPYWAVNSTIVNAADVKASASAPTAANVALLFGNTTSNVYTSGKTIGLFAVDAQEAAVAESGAHVAHSGWVLKTTGSGGRAGRVQHEVLVAMSSVLGDSDAQTYANVSITLNTLGNKSVFANTSNANTIVYTVTPVLAGNTSAALTYQWQVDNASGSLGWTNVANATPANTTYTGATTPSLTIIPYSTNANTYVYRVVVTAADEGVTATSSNGSITVS
jgi:hypothetical protein